MTNSTGVVPCHWDTLSTRGSLTALAAAARNFSRRQAPTDSVGGLLSRPVSLDSRGPSGIIGGVSGNGIGAALMTEMGAKQWGR